MAVHIPWDRVDDYEALAAHAKRNGISIGTVNANVFQDDDYKLGSVCNPDRRVRAKALAHLLDVMDVMDAIGSRDLKLWFADGTNYPGQDDACPPGRARRRGWFDTSQPRARNRCQSARKAGERACQHQGGRGARRGLGRHRLQRH
jgi:hypothetical protein